MNKNWIKLIVALEIINLILAPAAVAAGEDTRLFSSIGGLMSSTPAFLKFLIPQKEESNKVALPTVQGNALMARYEPAVLFTPLTDNFYFYTVHITAYSSSVDETDSTPFITAAGTRTRDGIVAANFLPLGTKVKIPELFGDKTFTVEDRMNRRFSDRVDVWFPSKWEAREFGKQRAQIVVFKEI